jgi:hypothetical protein
MVHLEQHHFGAPGRRGYHNRQWAQWMDRVGLVPSDTGRPGGKRTGERMRHYIQPRGPFARACADLDRAGFHLRWADRTIETTRSKPRQTRSKYRCPQCGAAAWAKPGLALGCLSCDEPFTELPAA